MYDQQTSPDSLNAISSPESASGALHFVPPAGQMIDLFGQVPVLANLSARQAKALGLLTSGTYGRTSTISSKSADLQKSLENRLRVKTQMLGSTLYKMTWKAWDTGSGRSRSRLRASVLRTSETGCIGWPTPTTADGSGGGQAKRAMGETRHGSNLNDFAMLAGWATPCARDHFPAHTPEYIAAKKAQGHGMANLNDQVQLTGPARLTATGELLTGSDAGMESGGQLNPAHSRWLMGLPPEFCACAVTATLSMPKRQKRGSKS